MSDETRYRFDRRMNVVPDRRRLSREFRSPDYEHGMPLFTVRRSSPARLKFKAARARLRVPATG